MIISDFQIHGYNRDLGILVEIKWIRAGSTWYFSFLLSKDLYFLYKCLLVDLQGRDYEITVSLHMTLQPSRSSYPVVKAQSNKVSSFFSDLFEKVFLQKLVHFWTLLLPLKVSTGASSNAAKIDGPSAEGKEKNSLKDSSSSSSSSELATEETISEFLTQVTTLVKWVQLPCSTT